MFGLGLSQSGFFSGANEFFWPFPPHQQQMILDRGSSFMTSLILPDPWHRGHGSVTTPGSGVSDCVSMISSSKWCRWKELNPQHPNYEDGALPFELHRPTFALARAVGVEPTDYGFGGQAAPTRSPALSERALPAFRCSNGATVHKGCLP